MLGENKDTSSTASEIKLEGSWSIGASSYDTIKSLTLGDQVKVPQPVYIDRTEQFDLEKACAAALSRLNYALEANVEYQHKLIYEDCRKEEHRNRYYGLHVGNGGIGECGRNY